MIIMRHFIIALAVGAAALWPADGSSQSKINPAGLRVVETVKAEGGSRSTARVLTIVRLADGATASQLEAEEGVKVLAARAGMAIVEVGVDQVEALAARPEVATVSFGNEARPTLDEARPASMVNKVLNGSTDPDMDYKNYRGTGVVLGMMDNGLDPNHVNFMNLDQTASRVKRVWRISMLNDEDATSTDYTTETAIRNFTTDDKSTTHATHVAGIMGGAYNKSGQVAIANPTQANLTVTMTRNVPYYGVAPDADLALGCGSLAEPCILLAGENLLNYAKEVGKPAVFNLSVGSTMGPHDGTDLFSSYLASMGEDMTICIASGNDGASNVSLQHDFTAASPTLRTFIAGSNPQGTVIDTWGADSRAYTLAFVIYDKKKGEIVYSYPVSSPTTSGFVTIATQNYTNAGYVHNSVFESAFDDSYVMIYAGVDPNNKRYNVYTYVKLTTKTGNTDLVPGLVYTGAAGVSIDSWIFGVSSTGSNMAFGGGVDGWTAGNPSESINGMACGENVIAVGSYVSRNRWPTMSGYYYTYGQGVDVGTVSDFTSYGSTFGGKQLPDLCAPGEGVVSSYSTYYVESQNVDTKMMSASATSTVNGKERTNWWHVDQGTSMAAPYMSGVAALLLSADPTMTPAEVKTLAVESAKWEHARNSKEVIQWGAGRLNAYEAMRRALGKPAAIGDVAADADSRMLIDHRPGEVRVAMAGERGLEVSLFTVAGAKVLSVKSDGDEAVVGTGALQPGVYVVAAAGASGSRASRTIVVK